MWYIFTMVLTFLPIVVGAAAFIGEYVAGEFYEYPLYDDYNK